MLFQNTVCSTNSPTIQACLFYVCVCVCFKRAGAGMRRSVSSTTCSKNVATTVQYGPLRINDNLQMCTLLSPSPISSRWYATVCVNKHNQLSSLFLRDTSEKDLGPSVFSFSTHSAVCLCVWITLEWQPCRINIAQLLYFQPRRHKIQKGMSHGKTARDDVLT